ncbi:uncharacterized protein LOC133173961 [Saccostrea echinata]|uniref:uncharacterized protein LOC133173961 n=1 Tax=Saccostrea echinata TaxID=191078 RepID=UPI002A80B086|nr:uncharacterized protein LOC133173961 [Saccostrea echinata]
MACTGAFECGFCPILIVVVSSVIICILMWKEVPKRIGGFSTVKIVIIVIFSVVAIGIGLGLGLGLREGEENCLNCGATVGISISLGVALSVMQFAIIFNCNNEKGCKDSKGFSLDNCFRKCRVKPDVDKKVTSDRSNGDRARTPTSASGVTMEAKKKSLNKPTEKGTEVSSLNTKPVGHPLPETPNGRKNQLEPISVEVDNSAREKKKKKKKKEKKEKKEASEELQF